MQLEPELLTFFSPCISKILVFCSQNKILWSALHCKVCPNKKKTLPLQRITQPRKFHFYEGAYFPLREILIGLDSKNRVPAGVLTRAYHNAPVLLFNSDMNKICYYFAHVIIKISL